jgi:transposase
MEVLYARCAGLDVHAGSVTACVRIAVDTTVTYEHRTVSANTRGLLDLEEWLTAHGCTHVARYAAVSIELATARIAFLTPRRLLMRRNCARRTRKQLMREIGRHTLRIQKTLEDANLKITRVVSDILGASGRAILTALVAGDTDPERLADLTRGRLKATRAELVDALHGGEGCMTSNNRVIPTVSP